MIRIVHFPPSAYNASPMALSLEVHSEGVIFAVIIIFGVIYSVESIKILNVLYLA